MHSTISRLSILLLASSAFLTGCGWGNNTWNNGNNPYGGCSSCGPAAAPANGYYNPPATTAMPGWRGAPTAGAAPITGGAVQP